MLKKTYVGNGVMCKALVGQHRIPYDLIPNHATHFKGNQIKGDSNPRVPLVMIDVVSYNNNWSQNV